MALSDCIVPFMHFKSLDSRGLECPCWYLWVAGMQRSLFGAGGGIVRGKYAVEENGTAVEYTVCNECAGVCLMHEYWILSVCYDDGALPSDVVWYVLFYSKVMISGTSEV